jgi:hypothetical protein
MAEEEEQQQQQHHPHPPQLGQVELATFRPQAPALWFTQAECTFTVKHVTAQFDRYCHVVALFLMSSFASSLIQWRGSNRRLNTTTSQTSQIFAETARNASEGR